MAGSGRGRSSAAALLGASASIIEGLAKARYPAAKAAAQAPAKQEVAKKRSCNAGKPMPMRANEEEDTSLCMLHGAIARYWKPCR